MNIFWFRRDLRLEDNAGLFHALSSGKTLCVFIFDWDILDRLEDKADKRVNLIYDTISQLNARLKKYNSAIQIYHGRPYDVWNTILTQYKVSNIFFNKDYEPYGIMRDKKLVALWNSLGVPHSKHLDHLIFKPNQVLKNDGLPYTVFTPYSRKWKEQLNNYTLPEYPSEGLLENLETCSESIAPLEDYGFKRQKTTLPKINLDDEFLKKYAINRDFPSLKHCSYLSVYLRFGLVSIRQVVAKVKHEEKFLNELIWREFYMQILYHFPHTIDKSFKPLYDNIVWSNQLDLFEKWCEGKTGYPIIDAGMRQLNETGFMHNRVRMICSSFLVKNLWIDRRLGEAYFASKLLDFELSSNVGGWQWAASCGCDAVPYFRIFNPYLQQEKFDKHFDYIKEWVPEFGTSDYCEPMVDYKDTRDQAIERFKHYLAKSGQV